MCVNDEDLIPVWVDFMDMTDAELDAELERANREYAEANRAWEARTPRPLQYAHHRRAWLELCLKSRDRARKYPNMPPCIFVDGLKRCQLGLWKLRWWYRTGHWPGSDA